MISKFLLKKKDEFKDYCKATDNVLQVDISVIILNDLYWPLSKQTELKLAKELIPAVNVFEEYYKKENDKKKLTWLYNHGNCLVNYTFPDEKRRKKRVELSISCIQACILLLFNEKNNFQFEEIREALGVTVEMLKYSISPLMSSKQRLLALKGAKKEKEEPKEEKKRRRRKRRRR